MRFLFSGSSCASSCYFDALIFHFCLFCDRLSGLCSVIRLGRLDGGCCFFTFSRLRCCLCIGRAGDLCSVGLSGLPGRTDSLFHNLYFGTSLSQKIVLCQTLLLLTLFAKQAVILWLAGLTTC